MPDNRKRLEDKWAAKLGPSATQEDLIKAVIDSPDVRDWALTGDDIRNLRVKHIDVKWMRDKSDSRSVLMAV